MSNSIPAPTPARIPPIAATASTWDGNGRTGNGTALAVSSTVTVVGVSVSITCDDFRRSLSRSNARSLRDACCTSWSYSASSTLRPVVSFRSASMAACNCLTRRSAMSAAAWTVRTQPAAASRVAPAISAPVRSRFSCARWNAWLPAPSPASCTAASLALASA